MALLIRAALIWALITKGNTQILTANTPAIVKIVFRKDQEKKEIKIYIPRAMQPHQGISKLVCTKSKRFCTQLLGHQEVPRPSSAKVGSTGKLLLAIASVKVSAGATGGAGISFKTS